MKGSVPAEPEGQVVRQESPTRQMVVEEDIPKTEFVVEVPICQVETKGTI